MNPSVVVRVELSPEVAARLEVTDLRRVVLQWAHGPDTAHLVPLSAHVIDDDLVERIARRVVDLRGQVELFSSRTRGGISAGRKRRRAAMLRGAHSPDGVSAGAPARQAADSARCETKS